MKIYTKTGDDGTTGLYGGTRVRKSSPIIGAIGVIDELNASLGMVQSLEPSHDISVVVGRLQHELFDLGAELATSGQKKESSPPRIKLVHIQELESDIECFSTQLPELRQFILPGGTPVAATLHMARTICRRAEQVLFGLVDKGDDTELSSAIQIYLNRLSDLLFVLARAANWEANEPDVLWKQGDDR